VTSPAVVVVGSCNLDLVARCATLPAPGETVLARSFISVVGGKGANQAIAAARAGARCALVGAVGDDAAAARIRDALVTAGVDVTGLRSIAGPSGTALIFVDDAGENSIVVVSGANATLAALGDADRAIVAAADAVLFQLEVPLAMVSDAASIARGLRVLNAAPARPLPAELLRRIDLLVVNAQEAELLAPGSATREDGGGLLKLVPRVALTLGADGVRYADRAGTRCRVEAPRVTVVDTTAAGDTFTAVLATALAEPRPMRQALELACAAASLCVETAGASSSIPDRAAIDARWASAYGGAR
jgi:ribokinase